MAKVNSLITLLGTVDGLTFVKSSKYGDHIRAARGTRKKAKLNKACQEQSKKLVKSNTPAKIIKDAIDPYRDDFRYGQLWQDLVRMTNKAMGKGADFDFSRLEPFEFDPKHRLDRLFTIDSTTNVDQKSSRLHVTLSSDARPIFHQSLDLDGYRVSNDRVVSRLEKATRENRSCFLEHYCVDGKTHLSAGGF
ncbi:MAG TPA: hypothetical protein VFT90_14515 [Chryseosolibacter sp.]|nr:hypothetical protein [Chryseosolibacter sp.]